VDVGERQLGTEREVNMARKEAWQMTWKEYATAQKKKSLKLIEEQLPYIADKELILRFARRIKSRPATEAIKQYGHRNAVRNALAQGKPVPARVLRGYPGLTGRR